MFAGHRNPTVSYIILEGTVIVLSTGYSSEPTLEGAISNDPCSPLVQGLCGVGRHWAASAYTTVFINLSK